MFLIPAAQGWNVVRSPNGNGQWAVRALPTMEEAAALLTSADEFVLALPMNAVLAQRLRVPTVDDKDFAEMVRIQVEKGLPYAPEEVTTDFEVISRTTEETLVSAVAVHNDRLAELAAPLALRGLTPSRVTVYATQRAATHAATGRAFLIYREQDALTCAISEEGKLSFTRTLESADPAELQANLPQFTLSAELAGVDTTFPVVLLDESLFAVREAVGTLFSTPVDLIAVEAPPAETKLNLLPEAWRQRRAQALRQGAWRRRLILAGGAYAALLLLFVVYLVFVRFEVRRLDGQIARDAPKTEFVQGAAKKWKTLAPAIDPHYYPIEVLQNLFTCLPSQEVRITQFNQSARQMSVDGEANSASLAYQFAEKVKKQAELQAFRFDMAAPRILPNEHAQFHLEGKPK